MEAKTLQQKLEERAEHRILKEIDEIQNAIDKVMSKMDQRIKDAIYYRLQIHVKCVGFSSGEEFDTNLTNLFRKDPIKRGITNDLLSSYLYEVTREFMDKVDSIKTDGQ